MITQYEMKARTLLFAALFVLLSIPALAGELDDAVRGGDLALVKTIVLMAPDAVNSTDSLGRTPLHIAAEQGQDGIAIFLLSRKARMEAADHYGATPLYYAAQHGRTRLVQFLLRRGAAARISSTDGLTPLHWAALYGYDEIVRMLLDHGADVNARSKVQGNTPLMETWSGNRAEAANILLDHGANIDAVESRFGFTALHFAVANESEQLVAVLMAHHLDLSIRAFNGATPAMLATGASNSRIATLLGASVTIPTPDAPSGKAAIAH